MTLRDGAGEILTFTKPLVKTGTVVSLDLQTIPNAITMALSDTDLLLVQRGNVPHKVYC